MRLTAGQISTWRFTVWSVTPQVKYGVNPEIGCINTIYWGETREKRSAYAAVPTFTSLKSRSDPIFISCLPTNSGNIDVWVPTEVFSFVAVQHLQEGSTTRNEFSVVSFQSLYFIKLTADLNRCPQNKWDESHAVWIRHFPSVLWFIIWIMHDKQSQCGRPISAYTFVLGVSFFSSQLRSRTAHLCWIITVNARWQMMMGPIEVKGRQADEEG